MMQAFVLIVDEDVDILAFCRRVLEAAGYAVAVASDGRIGLGLAETRHPDAILLAEQMQRLSAAGFLDQLAAIRQRRPGIVVMSQSAALDAAPRADCCLKKPFDADALLETLASVLVT